MGTGFGAGFHAPLGKIVDASAYGRWTDRWSRLFLPAVLSAAAVEPRSHVLDISTGKGEAAVPVFSRRERVGAHRVAMGG